MVFSVAGLGGGCRGNPRAAVVTLVMRLHDLEVYRARLFDKDRRELIVWIELPKNATWRAGDIHRRRKALRCRRGRRRERESKTTTTTRKRMADHTSTTLCMSGPGLPVRAGPAAARRDRDTSVGSIPATHFAICSRVQR